MLGFQLPKLACGLAVVIFSSALFAGKGRLTAMPRVLLASVTVLAVLMTLSSCATLVTAVLVNEAVDKDDPLQVWSGKVINSDSSVSFADIVIRVSDIPERPGDNDQGKDYLGSVHDDGTYRVEYRWRKYSKFKIRAVLLDRTVLPDDGASSQQSSGGEPEYIEQIDQHSDFSIEAGNGVPTP